METQFTTIADRDAIESEVHWADRDLPKTVYGMLSRTANAFPGNKGVTFQLTAGPTDPSETMTWREVHERSCQAANLFRSLGVGETDTVAYILPICNEAVLSLIGGSIAGIAGPINPLLAPEQIAAILRETRAKVVVTLKSFPKTDIARKVAQALREAPNVTTVLEVDLRRYLPPPKSWVVSLIRPRLSGRDRPAHVRYLDFHREMDSRATSLDFPDCGADRVAFYFHTGGTTGMPKVAQHTYGGMLYNGWAVSLLVDSRDVLMCPLPLFHVFACQAILNGALFMGAHVVFPTPAGYRGDGVMDNFWKLNERYRTTFIATVPTAVAALMQRPVDADISSVKKAYSGSAPMPLELFRRFEKTCGLTILEGYGLTEATCLVSVNPPEGERKVGSVGVPFPYTDVRIVKETPDGPVEAAVDEIGEICVACPGVIPGGTYTNPEKNENLYYRERYLRTGDLGRIDSDRYIWITGRAKDLIIRGGHNIDPAVIEEALLRHPAVAIAGAIGQPDSHAGEVPCAYVELVADADVTPEELLNHCEGHVTERAARPRYIAILPELPKTAVGKVFKPDLRKEAITRVYNQALEEAGLKARVESVTEDSSRGLVARVKGDRTEERAVSETLAGFVRPWEWIA